MAVTVLPAASSLHFNFVIRQQKTAKEGLERKGPAASTGANVGILLREPKRQMLSITLIKLLFSCRPWPSKFVGTVTALTGAPQRDGKLIETGPNGCFLRKSVCYQLHHIDFPPSALHSTNSLRGPEVTWATPKILW